MHCASLCWMAIELKGFVLSILGKMKEGDVLMLTVVVSLLYRLVSDCIFAVGECISSWAVVLPVNFEHVRSDMHNDFQSETDTLLPLSKLPTNLVKVRFDAGDCSINCHQRYVFCFQAFESQATDWSLEQQGSWETDLFFENFQRQQRETCLLMIY